jgi:hypothetical protein
VVADPLMTGPALLVGTLGILALSAFIPTEVVSNWIVIPTRLIAFFISIVVLFGAGFLLTGKGTFARTVRAVGFAQSPALFLVFALYQPLANVVLFLVTALTLVGVWMGAAEAHETKGWKTAVLPFIYLFLLFVGAAAIVVILGGAALTLEGIMEALGIVVPAVPTPSP